MGENGRAVTIDMLVEPNAMAGLGHDGCERGFANLKRVTPQVEVKSALPDWLIDVTRDCEAPAQRLAVRRFLEEALRKAAVL
jgi:hypothetical protein